MRYLGQFPAEAEVNDVLLKEVEIFQQQDRHIKKEQQQKDQQQQQEDEDQQQQHRLTPEARLFGELSYRHS